MNIFREIWKYWTWVCVALVTSCVLLYVATAIIHHFKLSAKPDRHIDQCIENGGTWDEGEGACKTAA